MFSGSGAGNDLNFAFNFSSPITLQAGKNEIALLSMTVGLQVRFLLVCICFRQAHLTLF